jgi:hypothetical protein
MLKIVSVLCSGRSCLLTASDEGCVSPCSGFIVLQQERACTAIEPAVQECLHGTCIAHLVVVVSHAIFTIMIIPSILVFSDMIMICNNLFAASITGGLFGQWIYTGALGILPLARMQTFVAFTVVLTSERFAADSANKRPLIRVCSEMRA